MHVNFTPRNDGPERLICEAELHFDQNTDGPLAGLRLVGFSLWRGADDETYATFPSRAFGRAYERRFFVREAALPGVLVTTSAGTPPRSSASRRSSSMPSPPSKSKAA